MINLLNIRQFDVEWNAMITDELLKLHDELEKKTQSRPWSSEMRKIHGYGQLIFWERKAEKKVIWDNPDDARYLAFIRNMAPEFVKEIRKLRQRIAELEK